MRAICWAILVVTLLAGAAFGEEVRCPVKGGELVGTVEMPAAPKPPVVVIIAGSGPTDRDGNNPIAGNGNCLKLLAEGLKDAGVASVRYDKRGIGASAKLLGKEEDLRFDDYAQDAAAWIAWAKKDGRFGKVFVLGHSEGALLGTMAAQKEEVAGLITVSGAARPAAEVLKEQLKRNLPENLRAEGLAMTDRLAAGERVEKVPLWAWTLFRPSVQPYVISWFRCDPVAEMKKLKCPVLIVQGTTDLQVPPEEAKLLAKAAGERGRLMMIEGMNHVLKKAEGDLPKQRPVYADGKAPLAAGVVDAVAGFVKGSK
jgi:alpha-beta hydrolase superfamily lysophospholipase